MWDDIEENLVVRMKDVYAPVRCQAILALARIQDSKTKNDPIVTEYLNILSSDPSK